MLRVFALTIIAFAFAAGEARGTSFVSSGPDTVAITAGWLARDCGAFHLLAPAETRVVRHGISGVLIDRRFTLTYSLGAPGAANIARSWFDHQQHSVAVGGRPAFMHTAEIAGVDEPYFLQLIVPKALKRHDGRWLTLEIHGWFANRDRRWLAQFIVTSIDFTPPFDNPVAPVRPRVLPPVIEIDHPSGDPAP